MSLDGTEQNFVQLNFLLEFMLLSLDIDRSRPSLLSPSAENAF